MRLDSIVVGGSDAPDALEALRWAELQLRPVGGSVVVAVRHPGAHAVDEGELRHEAARAAGRRARAEVAAGDPSEELAAAAFRAGADLVVVGPGWSEPVDRLIRLSPVPVMVMRSQQPARVGRVLAGLDLGVAAPGVLAWAGLLRDHLGAQVVPCHALQAWSYEEMRRAAWSAIRGADPVDEWRREHRAWVVTRLRAAGLEDALPALRMDEGDATGVLLHAARVERCDLVVLGTEAADPSVDRVVGRVRGGVLRRCPCPVLVVAREHWRPEARPAPAAARAAGAPPPWHGPAAADLAQLSA